MNWPKRTLGEIVEINPKVRVTKGEVTPFVTMDNVTARVRDVSASDERSYSGGSRFVNGDVLLARITPCLENGKIAVYRSEDDQIAAGSTEFLVFRGIPEVSESLFVYYWLKMPYVHETAIAHMNGTSGRQRVDVNAFSQEPILLPPFGEQQAISSILGSLDDKIAANESLLTTLSELYKAEWTNCAQNSERSLRLSDLVSTQYGFTASAGEHEDAPKFLRVKDINKQDWVNWSEVPEVEIQSSDFEKYRLKKGDILVARMADPGKSAIVISDLNAVFASYLVRLKANTFDEALYIYGFLNSHPYRRFADSVSTGSVQKNMNARVITDVSIPWPDQSSIRRFSSKAFALRSAMDARIQENEVLARTRDELLPLLMSGKITVAEAAEVVDEMDVKKRKDPGNV